MYQSITCFLFPKESYEDLKAFSDNTIVEISHAKVTEQFPDEAIKSL